MVHIILSAFLLFKELWREENALKSCLLVRGSSENEEKDKTRDEREKRGA